MRVELKDRYLKPMGSALSAFLCVAIFACSTPDVHSVSELYATRCASCHGIGGHGDGRVARKLTDNPARFSDKRWRQSVSREYVKKVILEGGTRIGISPLMPSHEDLAADDERLNELVTFVMALGN